VGKLRDALVRIRALGVETLDALASVTSRPARLLDISDLPSIRPGQPANLFIVNDALAITHHVRRGEVIDAR
jgi:adenine deaminase